MRSGADSWIPGCWLRGPSAQAIRSYVSAPKGRRGGARPVNTVDVMERIINRVVGRHRAFSDPLQASLLQRTPRGHIGGHHGDKHRGRIRIRVPGVLKGRSDHAGSETATAQRWVRDEVVKLDGADRHLDNSREFREILGIVANLRALQQADWPAVEENDEVFPRLLASRTRAEVALDPLKGCLMIPPPGDPGLSQPPGQHGKVPGNQRSPRQETIASPLVRADP